MKRRVLTLSRAVDRYVASLELLARRPRGVATYRDVLDQVLEELGTDIDAASVEHGDWLDVVATWRGLAPATIASRVSVIRSFAQWLHVEGITTTNTAERLARPRKPRPARPRPSSAVVDELVAAARGERERLVVWLLAMTGMRLSDLRSLQWRDVDGGVLYVREGKGGKGRTIPLPPALARLLGDVRARRGELGLADADHFVVCAWVEYRTPTGGPVDLPRPSRPCGETTPYRVLERIAERIGVRHVSPHQLRRAYADRYLRAHPGDIVGLAAILGHEHVSTTQLYLADARLDELQGRVADLDFVTPAGTDIVTRPEGSNQAPEMPDMQAFPTVEAAGVEPASATPSDTDTAEAEPSPGLVTDDRPGLVAPDDGAGEGA